MKNTVKEYNETLKNWEDSVKNLEKYMANIDPIEAAYQAPRFAYDRAFLRSVKSQKELVNDCIDAIAGIRIAKKNLEKDFLKQSILATEEGIKQIIRTKELAGMRDAIAFCQRLINESVMK